MAAAGHRVPRCQYATDWVADKTRWGLSIGIAAAGALSDLLKSCPDVPITVTTAH